MTPKTLAASWVRFYVVVILAVLPIIFVGHWAMTLGNRGRDALKISTTGATSYVDLMALAQALTDVESAQRAYLLTGNARYLEAISAATVAIKRSASELKAQLAGGADALVELPKLEALIARKLAEIDASFAAASETGSAAALDLGRADSGESAIVGLRTSINQMAAQTLLDSQAAAERALAFSDSRDRLVALMALISLATGAVAIFVMRVNLRSMQHEEQLQSTVQRASRENEEKSAFMANMSHEIRTPMNAIFGFTQLLETQALDDRGRSYLSSIRTASEALLELINDILYLSKLNAGEQLVALVPTDLRQTIESVAAMFAPAAAQKGLTLEVTIDRSLPAWIKLDPGRVRQIMFNLIGNAIKFTARGSISVRAWSQWIDAPDPAISCVIEVTDSGIGIAAEYHERIFEPFTQIVAEDDAARTGTGLGLSIVRRLAEVLNGRVELKSRLGMGAVFRVVFDAVELCDALPSTPPPIGKFNDIPALDILVVDDIEVNREVLIGMFAETHHRVRTASSGEQALAACARDQPDVVLLDLRMPGMDGATVLASLRGDHALASIKVVAVTAIQLVGAAHMGFDGYVRKPCTREALTAELLRIFKPIALHIAAPAPVAKDLAKLTDHQYEQLQAQLPLLRNKIDLAHSSMSTPDLNALVVALDAVGRQIGLDAFCAASQRLARALQVFDLTVLAFELKGALTLLDKLEARPQ